MSTISSIGTSSRNYSTIASWLSFFAAGGWIGELYNDSSFTAGCNFSGHASSLPTNIITLRCATGQSFRDSTIPVLAFDATKGANIINTTAFDVSLNVEDAGVTIQGIQVLHDTNTFNNTGPIFAQAAFTQTDAVIENSIFESTSATNNISSLRAGTFRNCLFVLRNSAANNGIHAQGYGALTVLNCTVVRPSSFTVGGSAFTCNASTSMTIKNCAGFGFSNFYGGSGTITAANNNASDVAISIGSSNQASKTYSSQFVTITDTGRDFRVKNSSADIYDTGATLTVASDIQGTSRPQGSAWDIGCWELVAGAAFTWQKLVSDNQPLFNPVEIIAA